jgi:F420-dependent oxidoreductase-like protein
VRFGLDVAQHQLSWDELLSRVRLAERLGFDGAWVFDHFKALYGDPAGPCLEGWTLLAGLAASTERIRLGALVTGVTYRPPSILAAEAITVDHISHGRLELGLGAAWHAQEHRELGLEFPGARERIDRLEEAVQVIRFLMTMDNVTYLGRRYRLNGASYRPRPVQKPHPPIWIGGGGERFTLPVVARNADFWHGYGSVPELVRKSRLLDELAEKAERDPVAIERSSSLSISEARPAVEDRIESLAAAGFSYLTVSWPSEGQERMEEFARDVMPIFAQK